MTQFPKFRITLVGDSMDELKEAAEELFGPKINIEQRLPEMEQDFLTDAAAQEEKGPAAYPTGPALTESNGDVDSKGFPWDERIHAASRALTKDGSWRYRRGVEDHQIKSVEQELIKAVKSGALTNEPVTIPAAPTIPASVPVPAPQAAPVPVIPPVPVAPPMPPPGFNIPSAHTVETFKKHMIPVMAKLVTEGKLTQDYISGLKSHFGVDEIYKVNDAQAEEMFNTFTGYGLISRMS